MNTFTNSLASTSPTQERLHGCATAHSSPHNATATAPTKETSAVQTFLSALMRSLGAMNT